MPNEQEKQNNTIFEGYAGLQAGGWNNIQTTGAVVGGTVTQGNTYYNAEVGLGTAAEAKVEAGHKFGIGKNTGLDLSAGARAAYSFKDKNVYECEGISSVNNLKSKASSKLEENRYCMQANVGAQFTYKVGSHIQFGAGLEAGVERDNGSASLKTSTPDVLSKATAVSIYNYNGNTETLQAYSAADMKVKPHTHCFVTPKVTAKADFGNIGLRAELRGNGGNLAAVLKF